MGVAEERSRVLEFGIGVGSKIARKPEEEIAACRTKDSVRSGGAL